MNADIEFETGLKLCPECRRWGLIQYYVTQRYECFCCGEEWTFEEWSALLEEWAQDSK